MCSFLDVIATPKNYYVVMERVAGQDLFEQMMVESFSHIDTREIIFQILQALKTLHEKGRIHKDLKMENVMVDMHSPKEPMSPGSKSAATAGRRRSWSEQAHTTMEPTSPNSP